MRAGMALAGRGAQAGAAAGHRLALFVFFGVPCYLSRRFGILTLADVVGCPCNVAELLCSFMEDFLKNCWFFVSA